VQFAAYEWLMARILAANERAASAVVASGASGAACRRALPPSAGQVFAAGAAAKLAATLATYPFLVVKSRQQARRDSSGKAAAVGPLAEAWALAREEGLAGVCACCARCVRAACALRCTCAAA
jgi:hypothetical protein